MEEKKVDAAELEWLQVGLRKNRAAKYPGVFERENNSPFVLFYSIFREITLKDIVT